MKAFLLIPVYALLIGHLFGKVRNGYEMEIASARASLQNLSLCLAEDTDMLTMERRRIRSEVQNLISYISYYQLTEELLNQFRAISPETYNEMDNIKDKRGRPTDIYVRLIPHDEAEIPLKAASFFSQASIDEDAHRSEYGDHSVSIDIWIVNNALLLLYHELGHVKYIIPNLASYVGFYSRHYDGLKYKFSYIGHHRDDPSGKSAHAFVTRFVRDRANYRRDGGERPESVLSLMQKLKRDNREMQANHLRGTLVSAGADRDKSRAVSRSTEN